MPPTRAAAIPTTYAGIQFRSRLEAKWARFFDLIGWTSWQYEPLDARGYIPDFLIPGKRPLLVEVKPATTVPEYDSHTAELDRNLEGVWNHDVLLLGVSPFPIGMDGAAWPAAGLLGERGEWLEGSGWAWGEGAWTTCLECGELAVFHAEMCFECRPCGHYDGDHHLGDPKADRLLMLWREAANDVQWWPRA